MSIRIFFLKFKKIKTQHVAKLILAIAASIYYSSAPAQSVSESWLRLAASACGGGVSMKASGDIEATLFKQLRAGFANADGRYDFTNLNRFLSQFEIGDRSIETKSYRECLLNLTQTAVNTSGLPPREIILDSPISIAPLEVVERGQRFVLSVGESAAIGHVGRILTVISIERGGKRFQPGWSDSETGKGQSSYVIPQSQIRLIPLSAVAAKCGAHIAQPASQHAVSRVHSAQGDKP